MQKLTCAWQKTASRWQCCTNIPDSDTVLGLNFETAAYSVWIYLSPCSVLPFCSWMQITKLWEVASVLHRRRSCTHWYLFRMAWTSPPYLSLTPPLWEVETPWCPGMKRKTPTVPTHSTQFKEISVFWWNLNEKNMNLEVRCLFLAI